MTPFVRLLVIFHFLRQALGTQSAPTNQTLIGLSLVLTYFLMQPVGVAIYQQAMVPLEENRITAWEAHRPRLRTAAPLHAEVRARERCGPVRGPGQVAAAALPGRSTDAGGGSGLHSVGTEGRLSDRCGAFSAFLVIDLVVASITTSVGMLQLPPVVISTPIKILLFVMVDGWNLLVGSLMKSFY